MKNCLACLQPLEKDEIIYHRKCLEDFWQNETPVVKHLKKTATKLII